MKFIISLVCIFINIANAEKVHGRSDSVPEITAYIARIPFFFDHNNQGDLALLHQAVMRRAGLRPQQVLYPSARAVRNFESDPESTLFPATATNSCFRISHINSAPLMLMQRIIITRKENGIANSLAELTGKKVGFIHGYIYIYIYQSLRQDISQIIPVYAPNAASLAGMLATHRIDVAILPESGLRAVALLKNINVDLFNYNPHKVVDAAPLVYSFHDTPKGRYYASRVSKAIISLHEDGSAQQIAPQFADNITAASAVHVPAYDCKKNEGSLDST